MATSLPGPLGRPGRLRRALVLALLLVVLEIVVFRGYFTGSTIPPWDYLGSYLTDARYWWSHGGMITPPDWVPTVWAGLPTAITLQNSAWYLPVGAVSLLGGVTPHSIAILQALHAAFGATGAYLLTRRLGATAPVALLAAAAFFFGSGYFANASHIDIARGWAWAPWVLLVTSAHGRWRRWWAIPVAALVVWQAGTAMYPGMLVSFAVVGAVWVIGQQLGTRARLLDYLVPLAAAVAAAVLLSLPRLGPYALIGTGGVTGLDDASLFDGWSLGTLLFGYDTPGLVDDVTMRSYFVPAAVLVLACFARWDALTRAGLVVAAPAALLGLPLLPWFRLVQEIPGMDLSRYSASDFKPFLVLGLVLVAASGLRSIADRGAVAPRAFRIRWTIAALAGAGLAAVGIAGPYTAAQWVPGLVVYGATLGIVGLARIVRPAPPAAIAGALVLATAASGLVFAFGTDRPWRSPRIPSEIGAYGHTVADLVARAQAPDGERPGRTPLPDGFGILDALSVMGNAAYFTERQSVAGYVNLKGAPTHVRLQNALLDPGSGPALADFLASREPAIALGRSEALPTPDAYTGCAARSDCGDVEVTVTSYAAGRMTYEVSAPVATFLLLNDTWYPGWSGRLCDGEDCRDVEVTTSDIGLARVAIPAGEGTLTLTYRTPGATAGTVGLVAGAALAVAAGVLLARTGAARRRKGAG